MTALASISVWVIAIAAFAAMHYVIPRIVKAAGHWLNKLSPPAFLLGGEKRRLTEQMQEERRSNGLPPLENPFL